MISIVERGKAERYEQVVLCGDSTVEDIINKLDLQFGSFEFYETSGKNKKLVPSTPRGHKLFISTEI